MPRFKGSRSTDNVHARDIQSRLRLAFGASPPVSDARFFAGRQDTLARIIAALEGEGAHAVIYGERGIGKTSLMHVLADTARARSAEHTSELQSLMRTSYAVFCLQKKN